MGIILDSLFVALPFFVAFGAYYKIVAMPYILIGFVIAYIILIVLEIIPKKRYAWYLYSISLCLMWQATMYSTYLVGSDIHGEYYSSMMAYQNGWVLSADYGTQSSTSWVVGWLVPSISKLFNIEIVYVYKAILPIFFAFVPVILYLAYTKVFSKKIAIYASTFFMIVPTTTLEIMQIGKSMVAELFLAGLVLFTVLQLRWYYQLILGIVCVVGAMICHYTIGIAVLIYLIGLTISRLAIIPLKFWLFKNKVVVSWVFVAILICGALVGYSYYKVANGGVILNVMKKVVPTYTEMMQNQIVGKESTNIEIDKYNEKYEGKTLVEQIKENEETLMSTALGLDFMESSLSGKLFRIIQYITQLLLVIGGVYLMIRYKKYNLTAEFALGLGCSFILLACNLFIRQFSMTINITRFYHISLFFIAPLLVVPIMKWKWAVPVVLIVYFIFTSGLVFELTKTQEIDSVQTPYSVSLSAERTGVVATYSPEDLMVAQWLNEHRSEEIPIVIDYNSYHLLSDHTGLPFLWKQRDTYNPTFENIQSDYYIFVSAWNTRHQLYIDYIKDKSGVAGLRTSNPLPEMPYEIIYQVGDAVVYKSN